MALFRLSLLPLRASRTIFRIPTMSLSSKVVRVHQTGGPEVLRFEEVPLGPPKSGEVRLRHTAIGVNFIDTYYRSGLYEIPLPSSIGSEGAGVVEEVGPGVTEFTAGDRVAYATGPLGSYCDRRNFSAQKLVKIPDGVSERDAAAILLKGMTAQYLLRRTYQVKAGDTVLVHAAAGGVGSILTPWAKSLGATVIGTVGSKEKERLALQYGADHVILYREVDFAAKVKDITRGEGVHVVYDGVGKDTFLSSLDCLRPLGMMVTYGNASGPVDPISPSLLQKKGSLFLTRPTLFNYVSTRQELVATADEVFEQLKKGVFKAEIGQTYMIKDAAQAHRDLESRTTTGTTLLIP